MKTLRAFTSQRLYVLLATAVVMTLLIIGCGDEATSAPTAAPAATAVPTAHCHAYDCNHPSAHCYACRHDCTNAEAHCHAYGNCQGSAHCYADGSAYTNAHGGGNPGTSTRGFPAQDRPGATKHPKYHDSRKQLRR